MAVLLTVVLATMPRLGFASTFTVVNLDDSGAGSLRQAILDANANRGADEIRFAGGLEGTLTLTSGQLSITDDLEVSGPGAEQLAVSGNHVSRAFAVSGGVTVVIAGLTITDGKAVDAGGGILNTGSTLSLAQVVLSNNQVVSTPGGSRGGAVANLSGASLIVTDSLFTQNRTLSGNGGNSNGGAIGNAFNSSLTVSRSSFLGNQARGGDGGRTGMGGGIDNAMGSTAMVSESTFMGNRALGGDGGIVDGAQAFQFIGGGLGGGIRSGNSTLTVENSTFTGNQAIGGNGGRATSSARDYDISFGYGGGLFNFSGTAVVRGSTFTGNQAIGGSHASGLFGRGHVGDGSGGGLINLDNGTATVTDSTFADNEARGGNDNTGGTSAMGGRGAFIVGWGLGGAITNEGWNRAGGTALTASNLTLRHNRAVGGAGNTGNALAGAGLGGGLASWWVSATVTISNSTITHNQAIGGPGGASDNGADGLGGGLANLLGSALTVVGSTLDHNQAQGGDGTTGDGGHGFGGGLFNDEPSTHPSNPGAATRLRVLGSTVTGNEAVGGAAGDSGEEGAGIGGGLYLTPEGEACVDLETAIFGNHASTSHDDIFGDLEECRERGGAIAFASLTNRQIYTINPDGSGRTQLTNTAWNSRPAWSPDGTKIAFARQTNSSSPNDIYIMNADGSNVVRRTVNAGYGSVSWSPDGQKLAVSSEGLYFSEIWVINVVDDGSGPVHISSDGRTPAWSPNGQKIAFVRVSGDDGYDALATMNPDGSASTNITAHNGGRYGLSWSPDGTKLASGTCIAGGCNVYSMGADGSNVTQLTTVGDASGGTSYSPDGTTIAIGRWSSAPSIGSVSANGGSVTGITNDAMSPHWRPVASKPGSAPASTTLGTSR